MNAVDICAPFALKLECIVHVGANLGQERDIYVESGASTVVYIEPILACFSRLKQYVEGFKGHIAVNALCAAESGRSVKFNIANNDGMSSSMLSLGAHELVHPEVFYTDQVTLTTESLDDIINSKFVGLKIDLLVIDTQGADLEVLRGAKKVLNSINAVAIEVSEYPLYGGGCTVEEITTFLLEFGFRLKWMSIHPQGWGDAVYIKCTPYLGDLGSNGTNIALGAVARQSSISMYSKPNDALGAINGVKDGGFGFHTDLEERPWWEIDLGEVCRINEIRVYNRIAQSERAQSLQIWGSDDHENWTLMHDQFGVRFGGVDGFPLLLKFSKLRTRHLRLTLSEKNYLHLDEVEVY